MKNILTKSSGYVDENTYRFGYRPFDEHVHKNMVSAVLETESDVKFEDSETDWHLASYSLANLKRMESFFLHAEQAQKAKGMSAQEMGYKYFLQTLAYENFTVFVIECFKQVRLNQNMSFDISMKGFESWIAQQATPAGAFVYFADTDYAITVRGMTS